MNKEERKVHQNNLNHIFEDHNRVSKIHNVSLINPRQNGDSAVNKLGKLYISHGRVSIVSFSFSQVCVQLFSNPKSHIVVCIFSCCVIDFEKADNEVNNLTQVNLLS